MDDCRRQCLTPSPLADSQQKSKQNTAQCTPYTRWDWVRRTDLHEGVHTAAGQLPSTGLGQAVIEPTIHLNHIPSTSLQSTASNIALRAATEHKEHREHTERSTRGRHRTPAALLFQRSSPIKMKYPNMLQGPSIIPLVQRNFKYSFLKLNKN